MSAIISYKSEVDNAINYIEDYFNDPDKYACFYIGRPFPWNDEYSPDVSVNDNKSITNHKINRIFSKKLKKEDCILAIKRFDWKSGTIYTRADHNKDYTDYRTWVSPESPFYCMNSEGNIYKCIANNNDNPSTYEPLGQSTTYITTGDGYIWKFMFDLKTEIKDKFLSDLWIPVPYEESQKSFAQKNVENNAIPGDIPYIHVINGGTGYTSPPLIQLRGNGTGLVASAIMESESIKSISISNMGAGYDIAGIKIYGTGTGAELEPMISPTGGHGSNAKYELGAFYVIVSAEIIGDEDGIAPITGTYRNIGIVVNTKKRNGDLIIDDKYSFLSSINISNCSGTFLYNETIIGETSKTEAKVYYDPGGVNKNIQIYSLFGNLIDGEYIHGQETGEVGIYNEGSSNIVDIDILSGNIIYKENIIFITRRNQQTEKFIFSIEF